MSRRERESFPDQLARVKAMAMDTGESWDLSENDKAALKAVLRALGNDEPCEACHKPVANGVYVCDFCLDDYKQALPYLRRVLRDIAPDTVPEPTLVGIVLQLELANGLASKDLDLSGVLVDAFGPLTFQRRPMCSEIVTLNGKAYGAFVDRAKRQILLGDDVMVVPSDRLVVPDMAGTIEAVERNGRYTVVTLGGCS